MLMNCGDSVQARPSVGAWVTYGLGTENQNLPGFVAMCPGGYPDQGRGELAIGLSARRVPGDVRRSQHQQLDQLIENIEHPHATHGGAAAAARPARAAERGARAAPARRPAGGADPVLRAGLSHADTRRPRRSISPASRKHIQDLYGGGVHGRQTLIARRLLERGVRYVQLWHGAGQPWDNHDKIEENHRKLAGQIDQPIAALLADLKQRGMLDDTLVIWGGEFGRTPSVELGGDGKSKLGRDHNHYGFTVWLAGGGVKGRHGLRRDRRVRLPPPRNPTTRPRPARHDPAPAGLRPRAAHVPLRRPRLPPDRCPRPRA